MMPLVPPDNFEKGLQRSLEEQNETFRVWYEVTFGEFDRTIQAELERYNRDLETGGAFKYLEELGDMPS